MSEVKISESRGFAHAVLIPHRERAVTSGRKERYSPGTLLRWLNMVEIAFSVLAGQCLQRRLPEKATGQREIASWGRQHNHATATV